jgi:hypothetical protein
MRDIIVLAPSKEDAVHGFFLVETSADLSIDFQDDLTADVACRAQLLSPARFRER